MIQSHTNQDPEQAHQGRGGGVWGAWAQVAEAVGGFGDMHGDSTCACRCMHRMQAAREGGVPALSQAAAGGQLRVS